MGATCRAMLSCLSAGTAHHATPPSPLRGTSNYHFLPVHPVFGNGRSRSHSWWGGVCLPSSFLSSFCHPSKAFCGPALVPPPLPAQLVRFLLPPPGSRGGRPVSAKPIGKQRPKIYFPVSSPSLTSKHSDRPWKSVAEPSCRPAIFTHDDFHRYRAASSFVKI